MTRRFFVALFHTFIPFPIPGFRRAQGEINLIRKSWREQKRAGKGL